MIRPIVLLPIVCLLFGWSGAVAAQTRMREPIAWDGLGANPNPRHIQHRRNPASHPRQDSDVTGTLPPRPDWYPVLSPEEVVQEKRLLRALSICRGCEAKAAADTTGAIR